MKPKGKWIYRGEWPAEPRRATEAALAGLEWLVPDWCREVCLRWEAQPPEDASGAAAETEIAYEYRWAVIRIFPEFFADTPDGRRCNLTHELLHIFVGPLAEYAEQLATRLLKEDAPKFHETVRAELVTRLEGAVQDLANTIHAREATR